MHSCTPQIFILFLLSKGTTKHIHSFKNTTPLLGSVSYTSHFNALVTPGSNFRVTTLVSPVQTFQRLQVLPLEKYSSSHAGQLFLLLAPRNKIWHDNINNKAATQM